MTSSTRTHNTFVIVAVLIVLLALFAATPAHAQEVPPALPVVEEPAPLPQFFMPLVGAEIRSWFTPEELSTAQEDLLPYIEEMGEEFIGEAVCEGMGDGLLTFCVQPMTGNMAAAYWWDGGEVLTALMSATTFEDGSGIVNDHNAEPVILSNGWTLVPDPNASELAFCMGGWPCDDGEGGSLQRR